MASSSHQSVGSASATPSPQLKAKPTTPSQISRTSSLQSRTRTSPRDQRNASVRIRRGSVGVKDRSNSVTQRSRSNTRGEQAPNSLISQVRAMELANKLEIKSKQHDNEEVLHSSTGTRAAAGEELSEVGGSSAEDKLRARNEAALKQQKAEKARLMMEREIGGVLSGKGKKSKISDLLHSKKGDRNVDSSDEEDEIKHSTPGVEKNVGFDLEGLTKGDKKRKKHPKMPKWRKNKNRPSVMSKLAEQQQSAIERRDEERRATRASRFSELNPSDGYKDGEQVEDDDLERQRGDDDQEFENSEVVSTLDVVDPSISAITHLSNIANAIIFPPIPRLYNRAPIVAIPDLGEEEEGRISSETLTTIAESTPVTPSELDQETQRLHAPPALTKSKTERAELTAKKPQNLDEHVKDVMRKRDMAKRGLKGVWAFLKTPLGVIVGIYGFLVVFFGAGLVLFLAGWVDGGKNKDFWVEVFSQGINALFTITGVGLIPWRLRDTYWICRICHYQHKTWRLRRERGLPKLRDCNDLPEEGVTGVTTGVAVRREEFEKGIITPADEKLREQFEMQEALKKDSTSKSNLESTDEVETPEHELKKEKEVKPIPVDDDDDGSSIGSGSAAPSSIVRAGQDDRLRLPPDYDEEQVLTTKESDDLHRLQKLFAESNSFYRPHETATHRAFPISWALGVTLLNDGNSLFQCLLCAAMWGYAGFANDKYMDRPAWMTALGIVLSFSCGIGSGVLIWRGGERTKKRDEVEKRLKAAFEEEERLDKLEKEEFEQRWTELMEGSPAENFAESVKQHQEEEDKVDQKAQDSALTNLVGPGGIPAQARD